MSLKKGVVGIEKFAMVPNKLFYTKDDNESLFSKCKDYKLLLLMSYLHINTNRIGITIFSVEDIIKECGLKVNNNKGKSCDQIKHLIRLLQDEELLDNSFDINTVKPKQMIKCKYFGIQKDDNGNMINFTTINYNAITKMMQYSENSIDNIKLVYYYGYLSCRMYRRSNSEGNVRNGGRAEVCYPSYQCITDDTGLVDATIKQYNDILISLDLIRIGNLGTYIDKNDKVLVKRESPNFYVFVKEEDIGREKTDTEWYVNLKVAMNVFKDMYPNRIFIGEKDNYKNNNKSLNGYKGSLIKKQKNGTITELEKIELENINYDYSSEIVDVKKEIKAVNKNIINHLSRYEDVSINNEIYEDWKDYFNKDNIVDIDEHRRILQYLRETERQIKYSVNEAYASTEEITLIYDKVEEISKLSTNEKLTITAERLFRNQGVENTNLLLRNKYNAIISNLNDAIIEARA